MEPEENELCQKCKEGAAQLMHLCPCLHELNDDTETLCNCCEECQNDCSEEI